VKFDNWIWKMWNWWKKNLKYESQHYWNIWYLSNIWYMILLTCPLFVSITSFFPCSYSGFIYHIIDISIKLYIWKLLSSIRVYFVKLNTNFITYIDNFWSTPRVHSWPNEPKKTLDCKQNQSKLQKYVCFVFWNHGKLLYVHSWGLAY
jgi:hypothetical protein